jgi:hypothetical protein
LVDPGVECCVGGESFGSDDDPASHGSGGEVEDPGARLGDCLVVGFVADRTISSSPETPTAMFPPIMKAIPPNISFSVTSGWLPMRERMSSARRWS